MFTWKMFIATIVKSVIHNQGVIKDFYNFVEFLGPTSITSDIFVAETLLMIFPLE